MAGLMQSMLPWLTSGQNLTNAGTLIGAGGQIYAGLAADQAGASEAKQLRYAAGAARASSQRAAVEERRQARLLQSRGLAVAAASGGGASDVTVVNTLADVAKEGEYRALSALYEGNERAVGYENAGKVAKAEGRASSLVGFMGGASSLLTGAAENGWFEKYGPKKSALIDPRDSYAQES
jgi:hypothetical protein